MTPPPRKTNYYSHCNFPAHGRVVASHTRRLSGHSVSAMRHSANGIVARMGPQLDGVRHAASAVHHAFVLRNGTRASAPLAELMVFGGGVASWRVNHDGVSRRPVPGEEHPERKTGPEMGLKKIALWTEKSCSATSHGSQCRAAPNNSSLSTPAAGARPPSAGYPERAGRPAMRSAPWSQISWCGSDRSPRCAAALRVRSTVSCCVGVASCPLPNRARCRRRGLGERGEQLFLETLREKNCLSSAAYASRSGLTRRPRIYLSAPDAASATPIFSSPAIASRTPASRTRFSARSSADHSSGDGLGIQQPGSNISGGSLYATARSGRARDRAICPAVARSDRRVA